MALKIFSSFRGFVSSFAKAITSFPGWLAEQIRYVLDHFTKIRTNLKDLTKTNLDLGKFHFQNKNLRDAIFRFRIVERFLDPSNKQACYYLGWCYMHKGDIKKAMEYLVKAGDSDETNLRQFLRTIDSVETIPASIEKINRDIIAEDYIDRFAGPKFYIPTELVNEVNAHILTLPESYEVLELGSNIGVLGLEMRKRLPEKFNLTGVENSEIMAQMLESIDAEQEVQNYSRILNQPLTEFLNNSNMKYDLITSLDGFSFTSNLADLFARVKSVLADGGTFAFATKTAPNAYFDKTLMEFYHDATQLTQALEENGFKIMHGRQIKLEKNNTFSIFVVKTT